MRPKKAPDHSPKKAPAAANPGPHDRSMMQIQRACERQQAQHHQNLPAQLEYARKTPKAISTLGSIDGQKSSQKVPTPVGLAVPAAAPTERLQLVPPEQH